MRTTDWPGIAALVIVIAGFAAAAALAQTVAPPGTPSTNGTACGAEAVGLDTRTGFVVRMALPGNRVDERGHWVACDRPCVGDNKPRTWMVAGASCTTASARGYSGVDDQRLNRVIPHGQTAMWRVEEGPMVGLLIERCDDGARSVAYASCWRPATAPAPVASAPAPVASATVAVEPGCGKQTVSRNGLTAVYSGPRLADGASTALRLGLRYVPAWCRDGRITLDPPAVSADDAASAGEAWRRGR